MYKSYSYNGGRNAFVAIFVLIIVLFGIWGWNLSKFLSCDFESNFRCEVVHGVGVFIPPTSIITVWFDTDDNS